MSIRTAYRASTAAPAMRMAVYIRLGMKSLSMVRVTMGYTMPITEISREAPISRASIFRWGR